MKKQYLSLMLLVLITASCTTVVVPQSNQYGNPEIIGETYKGTDSIGVFNALLMKSLYAFNYPYTRSMFLETDRPECWVYNNGGYMTSAGAPGRQIESLWMPYDKDELVIYENVSGVKYGDGHHDMQLELVTDHLPNDAELVYVIKAKIALLDQEEGLPQYRYITYHVVRFNNILYLAHLGYKKVP